MSIFIYSKPYRHAPGLLRFGAADLLLFHRLFDHFNHKSEHIFDALQDEAWAKDITRFVAGNDFNSFYHIERFRRTFPNLQHFQIGVSAAGLTANDPIYRSVRYPFLWHYIWTRVCKDVDTAWNKIVPACEFWKVVIDELARRLNARPDGHTDARAPLQVSLYQV